MKNKPEIFRKTWKLAFVKGGMDALFADRPLELDIVTNPYKDRWFADPFVLDVTEDKIFILAEEFCQELGKGRIAKLTIDRHSMAIEKMDIILECPTHLSFPNIFRRDGKVFVYPENCRSGRLDLYEYDPKEEKLTFAQTLCHEPLWDSSMTDLLGHRQLFGAFKDDYWMDVHDWDEGKKTFVYTHSLESKEKNNRLAGQLFEYKGNVYIPTQDCSETYGGGVWLKRVVGRGKDMRLESEKKIVPPAYTHAQGLHTLNEYKGVVVIDLKCWVHPLGGKLYEFYDKIAGKKSTRS